MTHVEKAPAKVNVFLHVVGSRPDGFHDIVTVLHMLDLHDTVHLEVGTATRASAASPLSIEVSVGGDGFQSLPTGEGNLAYDAVRLLEPYLRERQMNHVAVHIEKRIPIGAGLAGGSADVAAVLRGLNHMLQLRLPDHTLVTLGSRIGSDIAACLLGGTVLAEGRGERVQRLHAGSGLWWVLVNPGGQLSAGEVYSRWRRRNDRKAVASVVDPDISSAVPDALLQGLRESDATTVARFMRNDLSAPVYDLCPAVQQVVHDMTGEGLLGVLVSGSGPTVFGLASDEDAAHRAAARLQNTYAWVWWGGSDSQHGAITTD